MTVAVPARVGTNAYGWFDEDAREYVITRPDTPTPWLNYLGEGAYGGIVSNTGGGYSFDRDPRHRRISRYRYNALPADQPGRYVYLRDQESGEYWSPTWQPVQADLDAYECRHGPGYTRIAADRSGIATEMLYVVPPGASYELWSLRVLNASDRPRRLRAFSYVELSYFDALMDQQNLDWAQQIVQSSCADGVIRARTKFQDDTTFFTSTVEPLGFDCDREAFVGRYRDLGRPLAVERGEPGNSASPRGNSIGSLCHELELDPGEELSVVYVLGVGEPPVRVDADEALAGVRADWETYFAHFQVETPDRELNAMVNTWNQVQTRTALFWSRFASGYDTGLGRGMGTRDSAQDTLGAAHAVPQRACVTLTRLWRLQFRDGHAWHQYFPLTGEGTAGHAAEFPERPQWFCDDHLWLVLAVCAWLRETGDLSYLDEAVPFADGGEGTVWEHMHAAIGFAVDHVGPHGLPRIGFADWDDTLNVDRGSGKAESVWCAMQLSRAALELAEVAAELDRVAEAEALRAVAAQMRRAVNDHAWDGDWYARAFDDDGRAVGVAADERHRINMNTQTWAVLGDVAPPERAARALESMEQLLGTELGIALLWPPYDGSDPRVWGTSTYPPGAKENGGIFCHANTWAVVAAAKAGLNERAYDWYRRILPLRRDDSDRYLVEPYVYCQNICGPTHPQFGLGRNSWLTGTAAWAFVAATQWILGIRPELRGLRIAPRLPAAWPGFTAHRIFRGATYEITVERVGPGNSVSLVVDGWPVDDEVVPPAPAGSVVHVAGTVG